MEKMDDDVEHDEMDDELDQILTDVERHAPLEEAQDPNYYTPEPLASDGGQPALPVVYARRRARPIGISRVPDEREESQRVQHDEDGPVGGVRSLASTVSDGMGERQPNRSFEVPPTLLVNDVGTPADLSQLDARNGTEVVVIDSGEYSPVVSPIAGRGADWYDMVHPPQRQEALMEEAQTRLTELTQRINGLEERLHLQAAETRKLMRKVNRCVTRSDFVRLVEGSSSSEEDSPRRKKRRM